MKSDFLAKNEGVIGLIAVFTVGIFGLGAVLTMANGAFAGLSKNRHASSGNDVFYAAESAMREGAYQYVGALSYAGGDSPLLNGVLSNTVEVYAPPEQWPYVTVKGVSSNGQTNRKTVHTITVFPEGEAFDYAVFSNNSLSAGGNATVNDGNIFANGDVDLSGSSIVNGDVISAGDVEGGSHASGEVQEGADSIPPPQIEEGPYRNPLPPYTGMYFATSSAAEDYLKNETREAIVFVDDNNTTKVQNTNLTGSLYVKGDLQITSGGIFNATGTYAAIVVEGNLSIAGGATINGIIYVQGSTSFGAGNNTINGSLISAGGVTAVDLTGKMIINFDPDIMVNWQEIEGLNKISSSTPEVIEWGEE